VDGLVVLVASAARSLGVPPAAVRRWMDEGILPRGYPNRPDAVDLTALERWFEILNTNPALANPRLGHHHTRGVRETICRHLVERAAPGETYEEWSTRGDTVPAWDDVMTPRMVELDVPSGLSVSADAP
jgi:hypothetical protein